MVVARVALVFVVARLVGTATMSEPVHIGMQHDADADECQGEIGHDEAEMRSVFSNKEEQGNRSKGTRDPPDGAGEETAVSALLRCIHYRLQSYPPGYPELVIRTLTHIKFGRA